MGFNWNKWQQKINNDTLASKPKTQVLKDSIKEQECLVLVSIKETCGRL